MASVSVMHEQQMAATTSATGSAAGLRRSPSLLSPSIGAQQQCSHQVPQCIAQAHQVEMEFANLSSRSFQLTVAAPNGEQSEIFEFNTYGQTATFCPRKPGCGHGTWKLKLRASDNSSSSPTGPLKNGIYLDGVGSLFFTVDDNLNVRLTHQEFLRFPSATRQCTSKRG